MIVFILCIYYHTMILVVCLQVFIQFYLFSFRDKSLTTCAWLVWNLLCGPDWHLSLGQSHCGPQDILELTISGFSQGFRPMSSHMLNNI